MTLSTIGITGGTGFIGQYLLKEYADRYKFIVITIEPEVEQYFKHKNVIYIHSAYTIDSIKSIFSKCDAVVHLAAKRPTKNEEYYFESYFENILISEAVFKACLELDIDNIVNISSRSVYEGVKGIIYTESEAVSPVNLYGIAKLCVENIAELFNRKFNLHIKSLRLGQVMGIGERSSMQTIFLKKALNKKAIEVYGKGEAIRQFIYVKDACAAIIAALQANELSGVFNICGNDIISNLEIAWLFCKVFENEMGVNLVPYLSEEGFFPILECSKAKNRLGFTPIYTIEEALYDMKMCNNINKLIN